MDQKITFKGFIIPRDVRHAEWLRLGQEIGEIKSPILDPVAAEQFAQVARTIRQFGSGMLLIKVRDEEIEIEFKPISISQTTTTTTSTAANTSNRESREGKLEIIKVTRENRPIILRQLTQEGWRVFFRNVEISVDDTGYVVDGKTFTTLNSAVKFILESQGKQTSQVNAWDVIRLVKEDRVAKFEL